MNKSVPDQCGWIALAGDYPSYPNLNGEQIADWVIIGGGFTGLAAARRISELAPKARILLIDGKRIGQGATGRNSGFVVANESPGHAALATADGRANYAAVNALDHAGIKELKRLIQQYKIECQWEDTGSIHAASDPKNFDKIRHHAQLFSDLGVDAALLDEAALKKRLGIGHYKLGVLSNGGALVQPAALAKGLASNMPDAVEIFENSPVLDIGHDSRGVLLTLESGTVKAGKVIVALNAFMPRLGLCRDRVFPLALTASLTRPLTDTEEEAISHAPSWGVLSPQPLGATMRLTQDRRILIRNTVEYRPSGINPAMLANRRDTHYAGLQRRFSWLGGGAIEYTWSGNICISRNSKPVFAKLSDNVFATGCFNASGVSKGSIMGRLIADHAFKEPSDLLDIAMSLPKPGRIPTRPIFGVGVKTRLAFDRMKGRSET